VRKVFILERDSEVIALFAAITGLGWPEAGGFSIERVDAREWRSPEPVDFLYVDIWDKVASPQATTDMRMICFNLRPKSAGYWGMEAELVSFLAKNRCKPLVTQAQFRAWARTLGIPVAAYNNRAWLTRIPDVATQLIFGGSPPPE
jgi:hypothetical protein